jgi:RAB protein geranylgeranyltransferase component A
MYSMSPPYYHPHHPHHHPSTYRYGKSPYIYPLYGLGGLPEGFSRLCAIHGGTFMLNKAVDEVLMDEQGKAWAIKTGNEVAKAPLVIGEPTYFPAEKSRVVGQVREGALSIIILLILLLLQIHST